MGAWDAILKPKQLFELTGLLTPLPMLTAIVPLISLASADSPFNKKGNTCNIPSRNF